MMYVPTKKKVTNPKQAVAIGLSEARKEGTKVPPQKTKKIENKKKAALMRHGLSCEQDLWRTIGLVDKVPVEKLFNFGKSQGVVYEYNRDRQRSGAV